KVKGQKHLVRYYISQKAMREGYKHCPIKTINATHIDALIRALVHDHLDDDSLEHLRHRDREIRDFWIREIIDRVVLSPDQITVELNNERIEACKDVEWPDLKAEKDGVPTSLYSPSVEQRRSKTILTLAIQIKRLDGKRQLLSPDGQDLMMPDEPDPKDHIVTAIGRSYRWRERLMEPEMSIKKLAKQEGYIEQLLYKYLRLINLGPDLLKLALSGHLPPRITLNDLLKAADYLDWQAQFEYLNLDPSSLPG
ncbi:MAG: hypothetical protein AAF711_10680, partial [Planctomycetota bacterium]